MFFSASGIGNLPSRVAPVIADTGVQALQAGTRFVRSNDFVSPIVFKFESGKFYSGIPLDAIKIRNPVVPKQTTASSVNAQAAIKKKMRALEKAQMTSVKTDNLSDGRIRYYAKERSSTNPGPTRGSAYVTEYNPSTGQIRSWIENYTHDGSVNRVHPKMLNGQDLIAQHYPPTKIELNSFYKKPGITS